MYCGESTVENFDSSVGGYYISLNVIKLHKTIHT